MSLPQRSVAARYKTGEGRARRWSPASLYELRKDRIRELEAAIGQTNATLAILQQRALEQPRAARTERRREANAETHAEIGKREALTQAQVEKYKFAHRGLRIDAFAAGLRDAALRRERDVTRGVPLVPPAPPAGAFAREAMRSRAEPEVGVI